MTQTKKFTVAYYERPYGNQWIENNLTEHETEIEARGDFNKAITLCLNSCDAIKVVLRRGNIKLGEFCLTYPA